MSKPPPATSPARHGPRSRRRSRSLDAAARGTAAGRGALLAGRRRRRRRATARGGITLERPPRADFGDYSTNAALLLAPRSARRRARSPSGSAAQLAARLGASLRALRGRRARLPEPVRRRRLAARGARAACSPPASATARARAAARERVLVEFVSANPTGPMHVGHARNAAYGDALARMLAFHGHASSASSTSTTPARRCARSASRSRRSRAASRLPEDGYQGDYVAELAARIAGRGDARRRPRLGRAAVAADARARSQASLAAFGVGAFDHWAYESALHEGEPSPVDARARACWPSTATPTAGRRAVAAHDDVRRRQGPRAGALQRRAHLLRLRHRLPRGQARARLRAPDRRLGRRPPRLRRCA